MNDTARHESGSALTAFMPLAVQKKCDRAFKNMKCFVVI
jgi:hypothetical protein